MLPSLSISWSRVHNCQESSIWLHILVSDWSHHSVAHWKNICQRNTVWSQLFTESSNSKLEIIELFFTDVFREIISVAQNSFLAVDQVKFFVNLMFRLIFFEVIFEEISEGSSHKKLIVGSTDFSDFILALIPLIQVHGQKHPNFMDFEAGSESQDFIQSLHVVEVWMVEEISVGSV